MAVIKILSAVAAAATLAILTAFASAPSSETGTVTSERVVPNGPAVTVCSIDITDVTGVDICCVRVGGQLKIEGVHYSIGFTATHAVIQFNHALPHGKRVVVTGTTGTPGHHNLPMTFSS